MTAVSAAQVPAAQARRRLRVMQVTDWLEPGGKERVALNIANLLPRDRFESLLCTTRISNGSLERLVAADVTRLRLDRRRTIDAGALHRLVRFNAAQRVDIMHAHGSSLFIATAASLFPPYPKVVWHDHYGPYRSDDRPTWLYRLAASRIAAVIAVNQPLLDWAHSRLQVPRERAWYVPNFVCDTAVAGAALPVSLPGAAGRRVICVAHLRPQKDHPTLFAAFALVTQAMPDAHLLIAGGHSDAHYAEQLRALVQSLNLNRSVTLLGQCDDVSQILGSCDVGVLSSVSEGFPLALIEYGHAGLAAVSTDVGQCGDILDRGRAGSLVPPGDPDALSHALLQLLRWPDRRRRAAEALRTRVRAHYGAGPLVERICGIYDSIDASSHRPLTSHGVQVV